MKKEGNSGFALFLILLVVVFSVVFLIKSYNYESNNSSLDLNSKISGIPKLGLPVTGYTFIAYTSPTKSCWNEIYDQSSESPLSVVRYSSSGTLVVLSGEVWKGTDLVASTGNNLPYYIYLNAPVTTDNPSGGSFIRQPWWNTGLVSKIDYDSGHSNWFYASGVTDWVYLYDSYQTFTNVAIWKDTTNSYYLPNNHVQLTGVWRSDSALYALASAQNNVNCPNFMGNSGNPGNPPSTAVGCPNGVCDPGETCANCPSDCTSGCSVAGDEARCEDGFCNHAIGENCSTCIYDCYSECSSYSGRLVAQSIPCNAKFMLGRYQLGYLPFYQDIPSGTYTYNISMPNCTLFTGSFTLQPYGQVNISANLTCNPPACSSYVYSNWSSCVNGKQTRTRIGSPAGCIDTDCYNMDTSRACNYTTYSDWGPCSYNSTYFGTYTYYKDVKLKDASGTFSNNYFTQSRNVTKYVCQNALCGIYNPSGPTLSFNQTITKEDRSCTFFTESLQPNSAKNSIAMGTPIVLSLGGYPNYFSYWSNPADSYSGYPYKWLDSYFYKYNYSLNYSVYNSSNAIVYSYSHRIFNGSSLTSQSYNSWLRNRSQEYNSNSYGNYNDSIEWTPTQPGVYYFKVVPQIVNSFDISPIVCTRGYVDVCEYPPIFRSANITVSAGDQAPYVDYCWNYKDEFNCTHSDPLTAKNTLGANGFYCGNNSVSISNLSNYACSYSASCKCSWITTASGGNCTGASVDYTPNNPTVDCKNLACLVSFTSNLDQCANSDAFNSNMDANWIFVNPSFSTPFYCNSSTQILACPVGYRLPFLSNLGVAIIILVIILVYSFRASKKHRVYS